MIHTIQEWKQFSKVKKKDILFYGEKVLDMTNFMNSHPGGSQSIKNYLLKDIQNILFSVFPHDRVTTLKKLRKYEIGFIKKSMEQTPFKDLQNQMRPTLKRTLTPSTPKTPSSDKKRVCFQENTNFIDMEKKQPKKKSKSKNSKIQKNSRNSHISKQKIYRYKVSIKTISEKELKEMEKKSAKKVVCDENKFSMKDIQQDFQEEKPNFIIPVFNLKANIFSRMF